MWKYYVALFLIVGVALLYAYLADPCNRQMRMEFASQHPGYRILDSGADEGSPESVRCRISYQEPESEAVHEDVWLYVNSGSGWSFSKVVETRRGAQAHQVRR